ncbi:heavy metal translocating P-type ATPase [Anianabacter salinae]|uniref:heavy metal translocating P-type ATPase n=1 Tax=Anianabacter salinae TaxID=2851023 RepID=UPI00225E16C8|nr:heavy metal translocating P-type ATPase [Anianabacter salinae]MBV0910865.1 cadmium-translocating P-type ATPase [Anianabacter salinae]
MTAEAPGFAACPACAVAPAAREAAALGGTGDKQVILSLPNIHCAACISGAERALAAMPGVRKARVNLTLKRAILDTDKAAEGAELAAALTRAGYEAHELDADTLSATGTDRHGRDLLMRLGVAGFAMMNVMLLSVAVWSGATDATRDLFHWISAAIALPTVAFSAQPFFGSALGALRAGRLNMDVPISLAILLAVAMSVYETTQSGAHAYFDAALSLTFFLLAGRYLDHRTRSVARSAAGELAALEVSRALKLVDGEERMVPVGEIAAGDTLRVPPGARVPVDGAVMVGASELDRSLLTGESLPVAVGAGDAVHAGEVNLTGVLTLRATAAARDSALNRLADLVAVAETARNRYTSLADRAARIYAPAVHLLALLAFLGWLAASGDVRLSLNIAVAVLIITCPCALGLAVPAVVTAASGRLFRQGLLIKSATALERLAEADTVVFDKTGTLTEGAPRVNSIAHLDRDERSVALALAEGSAHPLARALAEALRGAGVRAAALDDIREVPGAGVEARRGETLVRLGRADWTGAETASSTATYLRLGDAAPRAIRMVDRLRDGAAEAVAEFRAQGMRVILLSGDTEGAVAALAREVGIDDWHASQRPEDKVAVLAALAGEGRRVLMVGDGLNDTAALAAAHVSISPASALEATRVVSDIVLTGASLAVLPDAVRTARKATRRIKENFAIAALYNAVAIPIALAGFATPLMAALAMSGSSICVSLNALRLR